MTRSAHQGFSLIELLSVVAIIALLAGVIFAAITPARDKARDAKRKAEVSQIGRLIARSCYTPNAGAGTYDIAVLIPELKIKYPQFSQAVSTIPHDPSGSESTSLYMYVINDQGKCAVYANLEYDNEAVTLSNLTDPTPGGGTGVLSASSAGWNGSTKYFQVSN